MATQQLLAGSWRWGMLALATLTVLAVMFMVVVAPPATAAGAYSPATDMGRRPQRGSRRRSRPETGVGHAGKRLRRSRWIT